MKQRIKVRKADVWYVVEPAFPDYRGKKFSVVVTDRVTFYDTNWSGGTKNEYVYVRLADQKSRGVRVGAPWNNPVEGHTFEIPEGFAVVEHSIFMGKELGVTAYVRSENWQGPMG